MGDIAGQDSDVVWSAVLARLAHESARIRQSAIEALLTVTGAEIKRAIEALKSLSEDLDREVKAQADDAIQALMTYSRCDSQCRALGEAALQKLGAREARSDSSAGLSVIGAVNLYSRFVYGAKGCHA